MKRGRERKREREREGRGEEEGCGGQEVGDWIGEEQREEEVLAKQLPVV